MNDLGAVLRDVAIELEFARVPHVVVGSVASSAWGAVRSTRDIDVATIVPIATIDELIRRLRARGLYVPDETARAAARDFGSFNVIRTETGAKIDLFLVSHEDPFEASRFERRIRSDVLGVSTWIATAEDVVLAKLRWRRESRSEMQWRDCIEIGAATPLDHAYLRLWAPSLEVVDDLEALIAEVTAAQGDRER